jgi:cytochrome P450
MTITTTTTPHFPPGPAPMNNLFSASGLLRAANRNMLDMLSEMQTKYGDTFQFEVMGSRQYVFTQPDHLQEIVLTQASKFYKENSYKNEKSGMARFMGNGLVVSDGEFWKRQRKLVAPSMHAKRIHAYAGTMVEYTQGMLDHWRDGAQLDIAYEMMQLTLKIVAQTLFHVDISKDVGRIDEAMESVQESAGGAFRLIPTWVPTPGELRARRALRELDEIVYGVINERRASGEDKGDLLSMLLLAEDDDGQRMTDKQARDEAVTMFLAGHETTANALNWTFYLLAQHPDVLAKLHAELDTVLGGRAPTLADLEHLKYTEMVIKESMRILPPVWGFSREAREDVQIGGWDVPKGASVNLPVFLTHRNAQWWPDPLRFDPERFSPTNEATIKKAAYMPFGGGPRVCIGNSFAMMEARLLLATIASRYTLHLAPGQRVGYKPLITLVPDGGLPMTLRARQPRLAPVTEPIGELAHG